MSAWNVSRFAWLLPGSLLLYLTGIPGLAAFAGWFFLLFFLRFSRLSRPWSGFAWLTLAHGIVLWFQLDGVIPVPVVEYAITIAFSAVFAALVFLIDRVVSPRLPPVLATLVFPTVLLSILYVGYLASPFGTWGDIAYTQTGFLLLLQSVSVVGIWGITFLVAWFAAIANLVLEQGVVSRPSRVAGAMLVSALTVMLIFGAVSLQGYKPDATITVATVAAAPDLDQVHLSCAREDIECRRAVSLRRTEWLLAQSKRAVADGAELVLWSEGAAQVLAVDEDDFLRRARDFAQENEIYLFVGLLLYPATPEASFQNRLVAITPQGDIGWDYHKAKPVPGERIVAGDGQLPVLVTPFGRITGMICFDADFPALARQAAELRADLLLVAANDWAEIEQVHADMAVVRAVENDVSLLRATSGGISVAATGTGKRVAESGASNPIMITTLPLKLQRR
jgi:apolipoprotein N-acyltransferase